jgi:hypothetical protein
MAIHEEKYIRMKFKVEGFSLDNFIICKTVDNRKEALTLCKRRRS